MAKARKKKRPANNSKAWREDTREREVCQVCQEPVPLKEQYTVEADLEANKVIKKKNAGRKGAEELSHYCDECAGKRVKRVTQHVKKRAEEGITGDQRSKAAGSGKAKPKKAAAKPKAKAKRKAPAKKAAKPAAKGKRVVKKRKGATQAAAAEEPF